MGEFRSLCVKEKMNELEWPYRDYIVQVARFDPAKGWYSVFFDAATYLRSYLSTQVFPMSSTPTPGSAATSVPMRPILVRIGTRSC